MMAVTDHRFPYNVSNAINDLPMAININCNSNSTQP